MRIRVSGIEITIDNWEGLSTRGRLAVLETAVKIEEAIIQNKRSTSGEEKRTEVNKIIWIPSIISHRGANKEC